MRRLILSTLAILSLGPVAARAATSLSTERALAAAKAALVSCERGGYHVTVTAVDSSGLARIVLRGDGATPHTLDSSRGKAYTVVTFAPINGLTLTSELATRILASPETAQLANLPNILLLSGGIALKVGNEVVGGLGVAGAPGGKFDEDCAKVGAQEFGEGLR